MTETEISEKYSNIEDKIPSIFENYEIAAKELEKDLYITWNIKDIELIRVVSILSINSDIKLYDHVDPMFSFAGLYPFKMKDYPHIQPEILKNGKFIKTENKLFKKLCEKLKTYREI